MAEEVAVGAVAEEEDAAVEEAAAAAQAVVLPVVIIPQHVQGQPARLVTGVAHRLADLGRDPRMGVVVSTAEVLSLLINRVSARLWVSRPSSCPSLLLPSSQGFGYMEHTFTHTTTITIISTTQAIGTNRCQLSACAVNMRSAAAMTTTTARTMNRCSTERSLRTAVSFGSRTSMVRRR